jgi:NAD(P)-dependent dehydrogenase (short-subunit alcohol dehydrogenase family)
VPGSWIVVTGAGRGIGATIAGHAAKQGYAVAVWDTDLGAAQQVATELGPQAVAAAVDVADADAVAAAFAALPEVPTSVVNNAGIVRFGPLLGLSVDDWDTVLRVNLTGTFIVSRAAAQLMGTVGGGSIVHIASINGLAAAPFAGAYSASKAGIVMLGQQMALEWSDLGVRVNTVAPGLIDAGMSEPIYGDPQVRELRQSRVPLNRLGSADDVAQTVMFLIGENATYITGQTIAVDGGISISALRGMSRPAAVDSVGTM